MKQEFAELLCSVADSIKTGRELWGSRWQNCEAEVIACQAISSCAFNYRERGEALSWQGSGTRRIVGAGLFNNPNGMRLLLEDKCIKLEPYTGDLQAPDDTVRDEQGRPMVIRVTSRLLHYAAGTILADSLR